ncbi:hypothetical protein QBC36DRAFT_355821 [Triangularia setosa]|uniref:Uncharacterized protein n=1 Tax=Triangularia setosa TaxID=2587417 RepID=A0AAN6WEN8_9PEZI|nr:hypothetical protein QBC36DRAFT_355821 [Podospora setosa]
MQPSFPHVALPDHERGLLRLGVALLVHPLWQHHKDIPSKSPVIQRPLSNGRADTGASKHALNRPDWDTPSMKREPSLWQHSDSRVPQIPCDGSAPTRYRGSRLAGAGPAGVNGSHSGLWRGGAWHISEPSRALASGPTPAPLHYYAGQTAVWAIANPKPSSHPYDRDHTHILSTPHESPAITSHTATATCNPNSPSPPLALRRPSRCFLCRCSVFDSL